MEGDSVVHLSISGGAAGYSRWNPTKEQIDMLEGLYSQGIRTPSAEQIQQITNRLRAFGHIEGKNVFYWFQNHKARQRQKQKQDSISYFNRFLHKTSVFPPCPNVCSPFCIPYTDLGLSHHQQPKLLLPRAFKRRPVPEKMVTTTLKPCGEAFQDSAYDQSYCINVTEECMINRKNYCNHQTLDLFPLQPSGDLQARTSSSSLPSAASFGDSPIPTTPANSSSETKCITEQGGSSGGHLFFDFFCGNGPCESH